MSDEELEIEVAGIIDGKSFAARPEDVGFKTEEELDNSQIGTLRAIAHVKARQIIS
jgi:hypothetical protein